MKLKIWHLFGWVLVYTFIASLLVALPVVILSKSRVVDVSEKSITYNPKEWPLYLNLLFGLGIVGYLYQYLAALPDLSDGDYNWGLAYLGLNILSLVLTSLKYFVNKDDEIVLTPKGIKVLDMELGKGDQGFTLAWSDVSEVKGESNSQVVLTVGTDKDSVKSFPIKLKEMNMLAHEASVLQDIQDYLSKYGPQTDESSSNKDAPPEAEDINTEGSAE